MQSNVCETNKMSSWSGLWYGTKLLVIWLECTHLANST